jgi:hypothetical protein
MAGTQVISWLSSVRRALIAVTRTNHELTAL